MRFSAARPTMQLANIRPSRHTNETTGTHKRDTWVCLALVGSVFAFYMATIRPGQPWPDDFAMYIHEAKNLVQHIPLSQTGYIYNPYNPSLGPRLYPPLFPILLSPAYAISGLQSLELMKAEIICFFAGLLIVLWIHLGSTLPLPSRAALVAIVGFSPVLWAYKDLIGSDIPFTFFFYATLALADRLASYRLHGRTIWPTALLAVLVYVCYGMRTMGIVLIPCLVALAFLKWQRNGRSLAIAAIGGAIPCLIQWKVFGGEASYVDQLRLGALGFAKVILRNIATYSWSLATFWSTPGSHVLRNTLFFCLSVLALIAYFSRLRSGARIYELVFAGYLAIVLLWPNPAGERYLIPIFPLFVFYFLEGSASLALRLRLRRTEFVLIPLLFLIALSYGTEFAHASYGPFTDGMSSPEAKQLFAFIRTETTPRDVIVFRRPRALSLYTDRSASVYPEPKYAQQFDSYFRGIGATYLVEAPALDDPDFDAFLEKPCPSKQLVFDNSEFRIFRLLPSAGKCGLDASARARSISRS